MHQEQHLTLKDIAKTMQATTDLLEQQTFDLTKQAGFECGDTLPEPLAQLEDATDSMRYDSEDAHYSYECYQTARKQQSKQRTAATPRELLESVQDCRDNVLIDNLAAQQRQIAVLTWLVLIMVSYLMPDLAKHLTQQPQA